MGINPLRKNSRIEIKPAHIVNPHALNADYGHRRDVVSLAQDLLNGRWRPIPVYIKSFYVDRIEGDQLCLRIYPPDRVPDIKALDVLQRNLLEAGVIDTSGRWIAGNSTFIKFGNVGHKMRKPEEAYDYLNRLQQEARASGGNIVRLLGNYELMYLMGWHRKYPGVNGMLYWEDGDRLARKIESDVLEGRIVAAYVDRSTGKPRLCTHGGCLPVIIKICRDEAAYTHQIAQDQVTIDMIAEVLNSKLVDSVIRSDFKSWLYATGPYQTGDSTAAGPFWADFNEFALNRRGNNEEGFDQDVAYQETRCPLFPAVKDRVFDHGDFTIRMRKDGR